MLPKCYTVVLSINKKKLHTCSVQVHFFLHVFSLWLVEYPDYSTGKANWRLAATDLMEFPTSQNFLRLYSNYIHYKVSFYLF